MKNYLHSPHLQGREDSFDDMLFQIKESLLKGDAEVSVWDIDAALPGGRFSAIETDITSLFDSIGSFVAADMEMEASMSEGHCEIAAPKHAIKLTISPQLLQ